MPEDVSRQRVRQERLARFERVHAVIVSALSLAALALLALAPDPLNGIGGSTFGVPRVNWYLFFGSCAVGALLGLALALRGRLSLPAYSLAAGFSAWSFFAFGMAPIGFVPDLAAEMLVLFVFWLLPWHGARFALHFPAELAAPAGDAKGSRDRERIRNFVDSPVYPLLIAAQCFVSVVIGSWKSEGAESILALAYLLSGAAMLGTAILLLVHQRRQADDAGLRRLRWIWLGIWGALAAIAPALALFPFFNEPKTMYLPFILAGLGPWWLTGCVVVAVFFSDALDPRLALRRATLYSILGTLMVGLFVGVESVAQTYLVINAGLPGGIGPVVAGSAVGVTFSPARRWTERWVQGLVERLMPAELMVDGPRKQATIAFVDLSGYTSLSDTDEKSALVLAAGFHKEMTKAALAAGGRVVKKIGDALLLEFPSNEEALSAIRAGAVSFTRLAIALELPLLRLHAGVHTGEVVHMADGDVMGADVNVAARMMSAARQEQVVISLRDEELAVADPATVERVECKGISGTIAVRRLSLSGSEV